MPESRRKAGPCSEPDCYCRCTWARNGSCPACLHDVTPVDLMEECVCPSAWISAGGGCQCPRMTTPPTPPTDNLAAEGGPRSEMSDERCPLPECGRAVWCRPPAPTCPHPGNRRSRHSPALHALFGGSAGGKCGLPGCSVTTPDRPSAKEQP